MADQKIETPPVSPTKKELEDQRRALRKKRLEEPLAVRLPIRKETS